MTGEAESHSSTRLCHTLHYTSSCWQEAYAILPSIKTITKILVSRRGGEACITGSPQSRKRCQSQLYLRSHHRLTVQPRQGICSIRPALWQRFHAAHLPHHTSRAGRASVRAWKQQQDGWHTHTFSPADTCTNHESVHQFG